MVRPLNSTPPFGAGPHSSKGKTRCFPFELWVCEGTSQTLCTSGCAREEPLTVVVMDCAAACFADRAGGFAGRTW